ncbi:MAG TPA: VanW family protein [Acidimicrobiia bacterium]|nr:VanW family protein [Acidimicrobiia bacterium]
MAATRYLARLLLITGTAYLAAVFLASPAHAADDVADEMFFYRDDGLYRYYDVRSDASLPAPIQQGDEYTTGWSSITAVDLDGQGQDEMFFYRDDGLYRYYNIRPDGSLPTPITQGDNYTEGWDVITAIDLDGDGQDEMFFYRADDGLFRYYDIRPNGSLPTPILAGDTYTIGWSSITAVDLDDDGQDEIFFYRASDGLYRYYDIRSDGSLGEPISQGSEYTPGFSSITAINLDGDQQDEMFFYRDDGLYRFYDVRPDGSLPSPILEGDNYTSGWNSITAINLQGDQPIERVARFTTFFDCCQNRVTNIRIMARSLDGYVVQPGETFSIDRVVGRRTTAKGYLPAPYLQNGQGFCCAIGGGVSQFGTTIHNAVFWGGFDVVSHKPHSGWISRYPLGIEATLVYSSIDYKFVNDTPTPLTIHTSSTGTSVTVELWGNQGGWRMVGYHPRGARSSAITIQDNGGSSAKRVSASVSGSAPGLVRIRRTLTQGGVSRNETFFWNYVS